MEAEEYMTNRVDDQITYYDKKSQSNQLWFKRISLLQIVCGACIPFVAGFSDQIPFSNMIVACLGIIIAVSTATMTLNKYQELWVKYRTTCETLRHMKFLYLTSSSPYDSETRFTRFVADIEGAISSENSEWSRISAKQSKKKD